MPISVLLPLALLATEYLAQRNASAAGDDPVARLVVAAPSTAPTDHLTAVWQSNNLVLSGLAPGADIRVYDVVGHVLAEFRSEQPEVRLQLPQRQLVAVCAGGECVGAR